MSHILDIFLHLDAHLTQWTQFLGLWIYFFLFVVIFAETGLIVVPFLPGDSLLFAVGALSSLPDSGLNIYAIWVLLIIAAIAGDNLNYHIGFKFGSYVLTWKKSLFFKPKNLKVAEVFFTRYGAWAVVLARFMPIVRTFLPFVAGMAKMTPSRFLRFNIFGAFIWISSFVWAGYAFGNASLVKSNFHIVIFGVIFLSILPMILGIFRAYYLRRKTI